MRNKPLPEKPTQEELARVPGLKARVGSPVHLNDKRLTDEEAVILAMVMLGAGRSDAWELIQVSRHNKTDLLGGPNEVEDSEEDIESD